MRKSGGYWVHTGDFGGGQIDLRKSGGYWAPTGDFGGGQIDLRKSGGEGGRVTIGPATVQAARLAP